MTRFASPTDIRYFKRYRMECPLSDLPAPPVLPPDYSSRAWHESLLERHGEALYRSFRHELDTQVFPSLGSLPGCRLLMAEIRRKPGFLAQATWLLEGPDGYCGTVQGVADRGGLGTIQNLGIARHHRGRGLGRALLLRALHGFRQAGLCQALLEVTAENDAAIGLYHSVGFRKRKILYKAEDATAAVLSLVSET